MISCQYDARRSLSRDLRPKFRRLRPSRSTRPAQAAPWPASACADRSRPFDSFQGSGRAASPRRSSRSSGWSTTTWHETTNAEAGDCPGKSCRPSPIYRAGSFGNAADFASLSRRKNERTSGTGNRPATAAGSDNRGMIPRFGTSARIRARFVDNPFAPAHFIIQVEPSAYPSVNDSEPVKSVNALYRSPQSH